jgi:hypothetical protein
MSPSRASHRLEVVLLRLVTFLRQLSALRRRWSAASLALLVFVAMSASGCRACSGVVNASPGLQWYLFENYGASQICPELLKRGMGLRMDERGPVIGRFFPTGCTVDVDSDNHLVTVRFNGWGYAWHTLTRKVTFNTDAALQFAPQVYFGEEDIYVWGKSSRIVDGPHFTVRAVENPVAGVAALSPLGGIANLFGNQIAAGELTRGFTVLQNWDTESKSFGLGIIQPPQRPHTPYDVSTDEKHTYLNETVEVSWNQRDFLGPFEVVEGDQQLETRLFNSGGGAEIMVVNRQTGDVWRDQYIQGGALTAPPGPVLGGVSVAPNRETRQAFRLAPGQYYIVVDNTAYAGSITPTGNPLLGGPAARISVVVQLGEAG